MVLRRETRVEEKVASCQLSVRSEYRNPRCPISNLQMRSGAHSEFCLRLVPVLAPKVLFQDSLNFEDGEFV
jgi:hypothetical protein